jgi:hypothetical protein
MWRDYMWRGKRWIRRNAKLMGTLGLIVTLSGIGVLLLTSPALVSAAFATANPTPQVALSRWEGDPQKFADRTRASVEEIWKILSAYAGAAAPNAGELPHIAVVSTALDTDCVLVDGDSPRRFDPTRDIANTCRNGKLMYLSYPHLVQYAQDSGVGLLLGYLVERLTSFKVAYANQNHFTACFAGAWAGYLQHWQIITQSLADEVQAYFAVDRLGSFQSGRSNRSLIPCLA